MLAVLVALFLGPVLDDLPSAILAAVVMVAVLGLIQPREFVRLRRIDPASYWVALITAGLGLTAGLLLAVGVGVVLTLVLVLRAFSASRVRPLYRSPGGGWTINPPEEGGAAPAGLLVLHLDGSLYTGNARPTQDGVLHAALEADPRPRVLILEASEVRHVTIPLLDTFEGLHDDLAQEDMRVLVAAMPGEAVERARGSAWFAAYDDAGHVLPTVDAAVAAAEARAPSRRRRLAACWSARDVAEVPLLEVHAACSTSDWLFITNGPDQATGCPIGLPPTRSRRTSGNGSPGRRRR